MVTITLTPNEIQNLTKYGFTEEDIQNYIDYIVTRYGNSPLTKLLMIGCENILTGQAKDHDIEIISEVIKFNA